LHVGRRRVPRLGIPRERAHADRFEGFGRVGLHRPRRGDVFAPQLQEDLEVVEVTPQARAGERLPEHHAHGEQIDAPIERPARDLLGCHVRDLPLHEAGLRLTPLPGRFRDAEVEDLHLAVERHHHVVRRHVTMHDRDRLPVVVGELVRVVKADERLRQHVGRDRKRHRGRSRRALADGVERLPFEVLHLQEVVLPVEADLVGLHDVRVMQARRQSPLFEEHLHGLRLARQVRAQTLHHLQLREPARPFGQREIDDPHASSAQLDEQAEAPAGRIGGRHDPSPY
jgi:hypothetical protein